MNSPTIEATSWGSVRTSIGTFRDVKLWPGGGRGWDWTESGTHHSPGVQPADVGELFDHGAEVVVIGRGRDVRLGVTEEARLAAEEAGVRIEAFETTAAVTRYNELASGTVAVGALIHSTC
ncbi:MAG: hypothetical protein GEU78_17665 [Actinobacteria bacterium]|nr:hypothetical protein [Actinomycetota bacterium]